MEIIRSIQEMSALTSQYRSTGKTIGFVPTMGYLHEGHLSLMRIARSHCDVLVVSIFVNPTQFGSGEDFSTYPRDFERDNNLCERENVDIIFYPDAGEMYLKNASTFVEVTGRITKNLCGRFRPGHFRGVTTVVMKLFNIIQPHFAVLGQKDGQQLAVIRRMVRDLDIPVEIIAGPTVREDDGLAMSTRNRYLSMEDRKVAPALYRSLLIAEDAIKNNCHDAHKIIEMMQRSIESSGPFRIQYIEIVDADSLEPVKHIDGSVMIALAAFLGNTRLIDNIIVGA